MLAKISIFEDHFSLHKAAYTHVRDVLAAALDARGRAVMLGAGGSTPGPVYQSLSQADLDWENITIGLTDERWVSSAHDASNEALIRKKLLQNKAEKAPFLPMVTQADRSPFTEISEINMRYHEAAQTCDMMILGMGPDAHTLSWFPQAEGLTEALDPDNPSMVAAIRARQTAVTGSNTDRMTLTLGAVKKSKHVLLLLTGSEKRDVLESAGPDTPIGHMIQATSDRLSTYWAP